MIYASGLPELLMTFTIMLCDILKLLISFVLSVVNMADMMDDVNGPL